MERIESLSDEALASRAVHDEAAAEELLRRYEPLCHKQAGKWRSPGLEFGDWLVAAKMGVWKAIKGYEPSKASFSTYCYMCVHSELSHFAVGADTIREQVVNRAISIDQCLADKMSPMHRILSEEDHSEATIERLDAQNQHSYNWNIFVEVRRDLTDRENRILDHMLAGMRNREVASHVSAEFPDEPVTTQTVYSLKVKVRRIMARKGAKV